MTPREELIELVKQIPAAEDFRKTLLQGAANMTDEQVDISLARLKRLEASAEFLKSQIEILRQLKKKTNG